MGQKQIARGAVISYVSIFLNIVITLVYTPWMIKCMGDSDYGLYALVGSFLSYFLLDFGLSSTITRFIAKYRAEGNETKVANMLGLTAKVYFVLDAFIFVVLFILYFFLSSIFGSGLSPEEVNRLKVLYCIAGTFSVLSFVFTPVNGAMMAYEFFVDSKVLDLVVRVGTVILIVIALLLNGNVFHVVFITGFVGFVVSIIRYWVFVKKSKLKINWNFFDRGDLIALFSFSGWILLVQLAQMFRLNLIPTVLGIFSNTTEISIFSIGRCLEGTVFTISAALNGLFLPMVSRMVLSKDRKGIMDLMIKVGRIQLYIILLIFSGFCVFGETFINLWVGDTFDGAYNSYYVFLFLVFVNIVSLTMQIGMDLVYAENKVKETALRVLFSSLIGLILSIVVAPKYGAVGCAASTGIALVLTQLLYIDFFQRKMGLDMKHFFGQCHLKIVPIIAVYMIVGFMASRQLPPIQGWKMLIMGIVLYTIGFCLIVWFFVASRYEKDLIKGFVSKMIIIRKENKERHEND